jgi:glutamine amidotransferase
MSSRKKIAVINYGMGNIGSVCHALDFLGESYFASGEKKALADADAYILPGVGAFGAAMENLAKLDIIDTLTGQVIKSGKPFFGICLGMQLLGKDSVELGFHKGLGWIDARVLALKPIGNLRVPHVGWNNIKIYKKDPLYTNLDEMSHFYFDHSFYVECDNSLVSATFEYGVTFAASLQKDNIFATQFHPEKSQRSGLKMLRNFLNHVNRS